jgi:hypothetical protein
VFEPSVLEEYPELAAPNAGDVRIERHLSEWRRTPGDRWMGATCLAARSAPGP